MAVPPIPSFLKEFVLPVRNYSGDRLSALLDFVETGSSWGDSVRELGRRTFQEILQQPGSNPEENCLLLEESGSIQGYCLVHPEPIIGRAVMELEVAPELKGTPREGEIVLRAVDRAQGLGARVVHLCLPSSSPTAQVVIDQGFFPVRTYWDMLWQQDTLPSPAILPGFTFRSFQDGDAPVLTEVQNSAFGASWGFSPNTVEQIEYRSSMANTSHQGIIFLCHGEETAGYCWTCLTPVEDSVRGLIGMIGVVPNYRGRGISRSILIAGMESLRSQGVADIGLQVDGDNTPAVQLYTSMGFQKTAEVHWFERGLR